MSDQYRNAAQTLGGVLGAGLANAVVRQGELAKIADRINVLGKRATELNNRLMDTADRLFGAVPQCEKVGETTCLSGETGAVHDALNRLEAMINGCESEVSRVSQI